MTRPSSLLGTPWPAHFIRGSTTDELDAICLLLRYYQNTSIRKFLIRGFFLFIERISPVLDTFFFFFLVPWLSSFFLLHIFLHRLTPLKLLSGERGDVLVHKSIMAPLPVSGVRQQHNRLSRADAAPGSGIWAWRVGCHLAAPCQSLRGRRHFSLLKSCTEPQRLSWSGALVDIYKKSSGSRKGLISKPSCLLPLCSSHFDFPGYWDMLNICDSFISYFSCFVCYFTHFLYVVIFIGVVWES